MKRVVIMMLVLISSLVVGLGNFTTVYAAPQNTMQTDTGAATSGRACGVLGSTSDKKTFAYYLQIVFDIIKFLGPVLVLLMTIIDLVKITAEQKQDEDFKKLGSKTLKRFIYAAIIFMLPSIISYLLEIFGIIGYGTCVV